MRHNEDALNWLEDNRELAMSSATWDEFCAKVGTPSAWIYHNYVWLPAHWETLKEHGVVLYHALSLPKAHKWTDLFSAACLVAAQPNRDGKGTNYPCPAGMVGLSLQNFPDNLAGHYGGRRGWSKVTSVPNGGYWKHELTTDPNEAQKDGAGDPVRAHYGATFYVVRVRPTFGDAVRMGHLQAIKRTDGILITQELGVGSEWIALLEEENAPEFLLPESDRELLRAERAAEYAVWGDVKR